jgi:uncharacterized repeat protein (TIGR01451 family)
VPLLLKVTLPIAADPGIAIQIALHATFNFSNASPALSNATESFDIAKIPARNSGALRLIKMVDQATAHPGATIVYTITLTNTGPDAINNLTINDHTPPYTTFSSSNTVTLPTGIGTVNVAHHPPSAPGARSNGHSPASCYQVRKAVSSSVWSSNREATYLHCRSQRALT